MNMILEANVITQAWQLIQNNFMLFIWICLILAFIIGEIISQGITSIWFAIGALVAAVAAVFGAQIWLQSLLFIAVSAVLMACTRSWAKRFLESKLEKTNAEGMVGKTYVVLETINNAAGTGRIRVGDMDWSARAADDTEIPEGTKVVVREITGVKCIVEAINEA